MPHHHPHPYIVQTIAFYCWTVFTYGSLLAIGAGDILSRHRRGRSRLERNAAARAHLQALNRLKLEQQRPSVSGGVAA